jgi:small-conductance mechanosensitive channel
MWLSFIAFMGVILFTLISVAAIQDSSSKKGDMMSALFTVATVNGTLVFILAGIGYYSINQNPMLKNAYIMFILHLTLILTIIGVCVSSLRKLGIDPTQIPETGDGSEAAEEAAAAASSNPMQLALGLGGTGFALGIISIAAVSYIFWRSNVQT